ncbi:MAG: L,D-transpeptidase catalytic domain [Betaproteobacteria bacterium ADurb.Bin341]|nr:MAG: L,D-transpeptidase catalytic domain [Betaproteobacteria bacterium ADurb.Bin341]
MRAALLALAFALLFLATLAAHAIWPHDPLPQGTRADRIIVHKSKRKLVLMDKGTVLREYRIALGSNPVGAKEIEGDGKTPEGRYLIDYRNPRSKFHLSLHLSYPKPEQIARAKRQGVSPGGMIMIHGLANGTGWLGKFHWLADWTNGCIAVSNAEIEEIWRVVPDGTPIEIHP